MKQPKCRIDEHAYEPIRGGNHKKCSKCGDIFPCRHDCEHFDCMIETNRPLPDWVTLVENKPEAIEPEPERD